MSLTVLACLFFLIAIVYASVGFGGGSSYIALLLLAGLLPDDLRMIALVCNIVVVMGSTVNYYLKGTIPWKSIIPLVVVSIPMAYIGGTIKLDVQIFKVFTAVLLLIASLLMVRDVYRTSNRQHQISLLGLQGASGVIGLLSGIIGIGGGIFLSPVLHLMRWKTPQVISATASLFILLNSAAGLAGQLSSPTSINWKYLGVLAITVLIGGQIGNRLNMDFMKPNHIKLLTAVLVGFVGVRIVFLAWW